jgi:integrase
VKVFNLLLQFKEDIDFRKSELHIRRILHRCKNYDPNVKTSTSIFFDESKTQRSKRIIPLPENAISDLKKWKEKQEEEVGNVEFVVTDERGKYLEQSTLKNTTTGCWMSVESNI